MKTCPSCNNMLDNDVTICPYCGRNVIGITTYDYGLKKKGQVVDKTMKNEGISEKIYGNKKGIRSIEDEQLKNSIEIKYNINFKKNIGIFISLFFLLALIEKISTYKLLLSGNESKLYSFFIPIAYSILIFLAIHLKFKVRIKLFIVILLSGAFSTAYWFYNEIFQFNFIDILSKPINLAIITLFTVSLFLKYKAPKFVILLGSSSYILYQYFMYLKSINIVLINAIFLIKVSVLFILGISLFLFLFYDFLFFDKK